MRDVLNTRMRLIDAADPYRPACEAAALIFIATTSTRDLVSDCMRGR
jgi:hypothetical protein